VACDLSLFLRRDNLNLVWSQAKKFEALRCCGSNVIAVLSDASREDEKIRTSQQSRVSPDRFSYRDGKYIQSKTGIWIIRADAFFERFHITLAGRESEKTAPMIEQILKFVGVELRISHEVDEDAGIEVARSGCHWNAARGSEAHRSVDRDPASKGTEARSIPQMRKNRSLGKPRTEVMHQRLIRNPVEAIASNPCVEIVVGESEARCDLRHGLMKSVIETGEVCGRREDGLRRSDER